MPWKSYNNKVLCEIVDFLTVLLSFFMGYQLWIFIHRFSPRLFGRPFPIGYYEFLIIILSAIACILVLNQKSAYSYQRFTSIETEFSRIIQASVVCILNTVLFIFVFRVRYVPRTLIGIIFIVSVFFLFIQKTLLFQIVKVIRLKGKDRKRLLLVGTGKRTEIIIRTVERNMDWGLDIAGIVATDSKRIGSNIHGYPVISSIQGMRRILHSKIPSEVIITISTKHFDVIRSVISMCEEEGVQVRLNSDFFGSLNKRIKIDYVYDIPIISILQTPSDGFSLFFKRVMDITISFLLIILLSPLFLVIAIITKCVSHGSVLYKWNVVGLNKKPFTSWKFRTMVSDADQLKKELMVRNEMHGPVFKIKDDPRVMPIGKILRKYSLDELPQLFSVLKGDMSLVGPRPVFAHELKKYKNWHRRKLSIKPGMTCLWQISGRNEINDFDEWAKLDLEYIDNWSIWLDIRILFKTVGVVITGRGAS